jgi:hypothetical protein
MNAAPSAALPQPRSSRSASGGDAGLRGIDAETLANSVVAEGLTSALIWISRKYKVSDAGIRITELDAAIGR